MFWNFTQNIFKAVITNLRCD